MQDIKKRTIVYIDGFNLYYGLLRFSRSKWLDVVAFANSLSPRPDERPSEELRAVSTYYKHIPRDLPAKCQLPDIIPVGTHGRTIHRPPAWA